MKERTSDSKHDTKRQQIYPDISCACKILSTQEVFLKLFHFKTILRVESPSEIIFFNIYI